MVHRGVWADLVAIAFGTGGIAVGVELPQRKGIEEAEALATQAEKLETLSDLNSLTTASDSLKAAINRDDDDDDNFHRRKTLRIRPNITINYHTETKTETKTETNNPPVPRKSLVLVVL